MLAEQGIIKWARRTLRWGCRLWLKLCREPITLFTLLLVIVGFIQAWILWRTDEVGRINTRAWLVARKLTAPPNFKNKIDKYTEVVLQIENTGKEPARQTAENIQPLALEMKDFRNDKV